MRYSSAMFLIVFAASSGTLRANTFTYRVDWDTTALKAGDFDPAKNGTYYFYAQLSNGDNTYGDNTVTMGPIDLGGGVDQEGNYSKREGGVTGGLGSSLTFTDTDFSNAYIGQFRAGKHFDFNLQVSSSFDGQYFPDQFSFGLYYFNNNVLQISTLDPLGSGSFLRVDLGGTPPYYRGDASVFYTFDSYRSLTNPASFIPAPVLTLTSTTATPEPSYAGSFAISAALLLCARWRRASRIG